MKTRKLSACILVLVFLCSFFSGCGSAPATSTAAPAASASQSTAASPAALAESGQPEVYKFGALLGLTGSVAVIGSYQSKGIEAALEEINGSGGVNGMMLEAIFEDHAGNGTNAASGLNKVIDVDKVAFSFCSQSGATLAMAPIATDKKVVLMNGGAVSPALLNCSPYVFANIPNGTIEAAIMMKHAFEKGFRNLAVYHVNDDVGVALKDTVTTTWQELGGTVVGSGSFELNAQDHQTELTKIRMMNPDVIYLAGIGDDHALVVKQLREQQITAQILGYSAFCVENMLTIAKGASEGALYTSPHFDVTSDNELTKKFVATYGQMNSGEIPHFYSANYYDGVYILAEALKKIMDDGGDIYDGEQIREAILAIRKFDGVSGVTEFFDDGTCIKAMDISTVENSQWVLSEVIEVE